MNTEIKTRIGELCRAAGIMTAYQLTKRAGFSPSQADRLFNDKVEAISLSVLKTLCDVLQCSPNDITGYDVAPVAVKADKPPKQKPMNGFEKVKAKNKQLRVAEKDAKLLAETLAEENSGEGWKNSVLDIVQSSSDNELLSTVQVAERLNVSRKSVNDYIISGKLPAVKGKGNHNFIRESDLLAFMAKK
jgi:excisionase family DNA binding protein